MSSPEVAATPFSSPEVENGVDADARAAGAVGIMTTCAGRLPV